MRPVIAIDGPAGAGKSTIARGVAQRLGVEHLDTGAMYRAVACAAVRQGVDPDDQVAVGALAETLRIDFDDDVVLVDGRDVTIEIRGATVTAAVSAVAANSQVRRELVGRQREWVDGRVGGVVEGRDIGTVVLPDAALKVYLTASPRVRAQRRVAQGGGDLDEIERSIARRDAMDSEREDSPLRPASDAWLLDTSELNADEVIEQVVAAYHTRLAEVRGR
jgi:cytidylate kinase